MIRECRGTRRKSAGFVSGRGRGGAIARRILAAAAMGCAVMPATIGGVHGDVPEKVYTYTVSHPTHGDIGTYRNSILDDGSQISVRNKIRIQVKVLLVVAHQEATDSHEVWRDGLLVSFSGATEENGKKTVITGEAEGAKFHVETPAGPKEAPASVYPNNPWSKAILKASVLLGTKSGNLYRVHVGAGQPREIKLGDKTVQTQYFRVEGDAKYELWFDNRGIPVKFTEIGENGVITFTLVSEAVQPASAAAKPSGSSG
jgi:type II secretory pathway pseudopilin PulG